jgi:hypothetical protein
VSTSPGRTSRPASPHPIIHSLTHTSKRLCLGPGRPKGTALRPLRLSLSQGAREAGILTASEGSDSKKEWVVCDHRRAVRRTLARTYPGLQEWEATGRGRGEKRNKKNYLDVVWL